MPSKTTVFSRQYNSRLHGSPVGAAAKTHYEEAEDCQALLSWS